MPLINENHNANTETSLEYWQNELKNARVLLFEINKAIYNISTLNHQSYQLDTGQSSQRVTRADLPGLIFQRSEIENTIRNLEMYLGEGKPSIIQVRPRW